VFFVKNRKYEILKLIQNNHTMLWGDLLNAFEPQNQIIQTDAILHSLVSDGLIEKTWASDRPPRCRVRLTGKGISALDADTSDHSGVDRQQSETDIPKKRAIDLSSFNKFLRYIIDLVKVLLEILRLLPL
jgi:DNA-binding HxlR family transcriptional regulator